MKSRPFYVAFITPVIRDCMGGLEDDGNSGVIGANSKAIAGLDPAGKLAGGIHGNNRLGGNSLRDCVVFGRATGKHASKFVLGDGVATLPPLRLCLAVALLVMWRQGAHA